MSASEGTTADPPRGENRRWPGGGLYLIASFYSTGILSEFEMGGSVEAAAPFFVLPEYVEAFKKVFGDAVEELSRDKSTVLRNVRIDRSQPVRATHITTDSGEVISNPIIRIPLAYRVFHRDVILFDLQALAVSCDEAAETLTDENLNRLLEYQGRIVEAIGQVGTAGGQAFGWPVLLDALAMVEITFDENGTPEFPMIVAETDRRNIFPYPPMTDADRPAFDALIARKRQEFCARRRPSQLS